MVLADFITERHEEDGPSVNEEAKEATQNLWTLFTDGSSCLEGSGAGLILINPEGTEFTYALRFKFEASNNEAEYEALIAGLRIAEQMGVQKYLTDGTLPAEVKRARSIKIKSREYNVINEVLYRKPFLEPWLRCVGPLQAEYVVREIHEGSCSMHSGPRSVVARAPFYKWGIDISGPFLKAQGKVKFLIVVVDYFTKWIEAKPVATITGNQIKKFVERENTSLGDGIKARLGRDNKNWVEELPHVLWAHHTEIKSSNGHTPLSLTYDTEAVISVEIGMPSL
ncbi:reverse transcriptase domain-containing protein, partial [Tanacetum coccineum]